MHPPVLGDVVRRAFHWLIEIAKKMVWMGVSCQELPRIKLVKKF